MVRPRSHRSNRVWLYRKPPPKPKRLLSHYSPVLVLWLSGSGDEGAVTRSLEAFLTFDNVVLYCWCICNGSVSDLTGVGGLVHFPQLDSPVEPDDGTEGERWQHALSSSKNRLAGCHWRSLVKDFSSLGPYVVGSPRSN